MPKRSKKLLSITFVALASITALAFGAAGCSDEPTNDPCFDYASFNGTTPAVAFTADVLPIFRGSCGLSAACHGSQTSSVGGPYLGPALVDPMNPPPATQPEIDAIFAQNVGVNAKAASTMKLVDPGKPETSFLMAKMDGKLSCETVKCETACGLSMPQNSPELESAKLDTVRRWIAQGAKKD